MSSTLRRLRVAAIAVTALICLTSCYAPSSQAEPSATTEPPSTSAEPATPEESATPEEPAKPAWEPPTDGTWPNHVTSGLGYGEPFRLAVRYVDTYEGEIQSLPTFTYQNDRNVVVKQAVQFKRIDASVTGVADISDFKPDFLSGRSQGEGNPAASRANIACAATIPNLGDTTMCTFSYSADVKDITNFSWIVGRDIVGAWPGQETFGR